MFREIPNTNGRYIINEEGICIDLRPERNDNQWSYDHAPREIANDGRKITISIDNKQHVRNIVPLLREVFPELYVVSQRQMENIKKRIENNGGITYSINEFNKLIWPNKVINIYDKTYNAQKLISPYDRRRKLWEKPINIDITNGITLEQGHTYFGVGRTHLIKFDGLIPYNGKPMVEREAKSYEKKYRENVEKKQIHITELYDD